MKRSWIGFLLLLILLGTSLLSSWAMEVLHEEAAGQLEQAADLALAENWPGAAWHIAKVRRNWDDWDLLRAALADHGPMEEIEGLFSVLEVYGSNRERIAFAAVCRELARKMEAIGEAHGLELKNLL